MTAQWLRENVLQLVLATLVALGTYVATQVLDAVEAVQDDVRVLLNDRTALQGEVRGLRRDVDRIDATVAKLEGCQ